MADGPLKPLTQDQEHASRPDTHVWLSASAGTGKTAVLSSRVLRLLLNGVPPERILCLTFTKAGAAEMAERVHSRLAHWVQIKPADLRKELFALGEDNSDAAIGRARLLFAQVLDATGGGLRIQTIHSFCQSLLAAFPLEAGLVPGFEPLDERGQAELSRRALIAMIETAGRERDEAVIAAIEMLALRLGEAGTQDYLAKCVPAGALLEIIEDIPAFLLSFLKLPEGDIEEAIAGWCADEVFPIGSLRAVAAANRAWGAASGIDCAARIAGWLDQPDALRGEALDDLLGVLLTRDGEVKNRTRDKLLAAEPDYVALASECGEAIKALLDLRRQVAFANLAAQALVAGRAYAGAYAQAKRQAGAVDFDDLIGRASELLTRPGMADWIRYKLDQRVDHILVDEAQDTNDAQWTIVDAVVQEYFEIDPDDERRDLFRTLFVVGDTKQAIFGFQGTSPEAFVNALRHFRGRAERAQQPFAELPLALSFRSMPAVLDVVDALLDEVGHAALGLERPSASHDSARRHPGSVTILPPTSLIAAESDEEGEGTEAPEESPTEGEEDWLADHQRRHAEKIAQLVKEQIGKPLATKGRDATPGDVLILLRSRGALSRLIVARLYEAGVPVAGVDRLRLQAPLAVRDLLAALRFAVQPEDDLNLANLLVSPLIGWSQDDLMTRAIPRRGSLWAHLRETQPAPDQASLRALLASADFTTPYRYLEAILSGPMDGRRKLIARLGAEARDAIDELVNAALAFEADDHPSLQRFIDWFDRGDADIKRELGEGGDMVRVMTVHGAKGLEAPIVILADAAADPAMKPRAEAVDLPVRSTSLPLMRPGKGEAGAQIEAAMEAAKAADMEEHWRLLYVALTRAEEHLIVTGALGSRAKGVPPELSWYQAVDRAMRRIGAEPVAMESWGEARRWLGPQGLAPVRRSAAPTIEAGAPAVELPDWLYASAPAEARPPRPLAPSAAVEDDVPNPPPDAAMRAAAERGRLLHILFERLPDLPPADRAEAAECWLAGAGGVADPAARHDLIAHVTSVLDDPAHVALFGPDALAEAPIAAVVEGQVIAGTVDRLLVTDAEIHVVDFKTGRAVPADADALPLSHVRQMAAYAAALGEIFPGRAIRASLLYTAGPRLIDVPAALIAAHKPRLGEGEQFLSPGGLETGAPVT